VSARSVIARFLSEAAEKEPAWNKKKDRVVYVLPETLQEESSTYKDIPEDREHHVETRGKPRKPRRPKKPRKPDKPEIPRGTTPAPIKPPVVPRPVPKLKPVPRVKPVKPVKLPTPTDKPRKWKIIRKKKVAARVVVQRYLATKLLDVLVGLQFFE